ncbi:MAG: CHAP domain-containing protein [Clostridiales bacterium]|nr:CHAP domain-containing protein [Clostridiales bacterium]
MKILRGIGFFSLLFAFILCLPFTAGAVVSPMSEAYKSGVYYKNLLSAQMTGYGGADVVSVAMSQLGYHEGASPDDFDGEGSSSYNFTEYNYFYGSLDGYGYAWCATFVSWCLRQAGIPVSTVPANCNCASWVSQFKNMSRFFSPSNYTPKTGDLIFFTPLGGDSVSGHVGIVLYTRNGYVYTIEGNTSDAVKQRRYSLSNQTIVGYGVPNYSDYSSTSSDIYIVSTNDIGSSLALRSEKSTASGYTLAFIPSGQIVLVNEISNGWAKITYNGESGWASLSYLSLVRGKGDISDSENTSGSDSSTSHSHSYTSRIIPPSCVSEGYTVYSCYCGYSYISDIVSPSGHSYRNGICSICKNEDMEYNEIISSEISGSSFSGSEQKDQSMVSEEKTATDSSESVSEFSSENNVDGNLFDEKEKISSDAVEKDDIVSSDSGKNVTNNEESLFKTSEEESDYLSESDSGRISNNAFLPVWIFLGVGIFLLICGIILWYLFYRKKGKSRDK